MAEEIPRSHIILKPIALAALMLASQAHAAGCRSGDILAPYQGCPVHGTVASLEVNAEGGLCLEPGGQLFGDDCTASGTVEASVTFNGVQFSYEATSISRNRWELLSISREPSARNQWPQTVGSIPDQTVVQGGSIELNASSYFTDPDDDDLAFEVDHSFDFARYAAEVRDNIATITVQSVGDGSFTLRAKDPGGLFRTQEVRVKVLRRRDPVTHFIPLFPSSWYANGEGFVRIINRSEINGTVTVEATDDEGEGRDPVTLKVLAESAIHFNSGDLEDGSAAKGIERGIGRGQGDWTLKVVSDLDLDVLAYARSDDGFVSSLHDVVEPEGDEHRVVFFNPGSNYRQVSKLRIVNMGDEEATAKIRGIDDRGADSADWASATIPAGGARTITADELERGVGVERRIGQGSGKWRLVVAADQPIKVMSLLESPTGNLTNLSTQP